MKKKLVFKVKKNLVFNSRPIWKTGTCKDKNIVCS